MPTHTLFSYRALLFKDFQVSPFDKILRGSVFAPFIKVPQRDDLMGRRRDFRFTIPENFYYCLVIFC